MLLDKKHHTIATAKEALFKISQEKYKMINHAV